MANVNFMGLNSFEMAAIKRNFMNTKRLYATREKLQEKLTQLTQEVEFNEKQIALYEETTKCITLEKCGVAMESKQVLEFANTNNEQGFNELKSQITGFTINEETVIEQPTVSEEETRDTSINDIINND